MKKYIAFILFLLLAFSLPLSVCGEAVYTGAEAAALWDAESDTLLYAENEQKRLPMASTTKIMTAIVALEQGNPDALEKIPAGAVGV